MKSTARCLFLLILASIVAFPALCSDENDLSPDQRRLYNRLKLSVEAAGQTFGTVGPTTVSAETWIKWTGYKGLNKVSEAEFFSIAGYEEEAVKADRFHKVSRNTWLAGVIIAVGGGLGGIIAYEITDVMAVSLVALGAAMGGALPAVLGGIRMMKNLYPAVTAVDIADEYNAFLIKDIIDGKITSVSGSRD